MAALISSVAITFVGGRTLVEHSRWVAHTHEVIVELEAVQAAIVDAESSQRGFVITGNPDYLSRYDELVRAGRRHVDAIGRLTHDNPTQQRRVPRLRSALGAKIVEMGRPIVARRSEGPQVAHRLIATNRGKALMEEIRRWVVAMENTEERLLSLRQTEAARSARVAAISFWIGSGAGLLLLTGLYRSAMRLYATQVAARQAERRHREELEERVARRTAELRAVNANLESFSYSAAHDLRGPLRSIGAQTHFLEEELADLTPNQRDRLAKIRGTVGQMGRLIDDLMKLSRATSADLERREVDLSRLARETLDEVAARQPREGVTVEIQEGLTTVADPAMMGILLDNLLRNAWKYSGKVSDATIAFGRDDAGAYFVRDNGAGFDDAKFQEALEPFHRLHTDEEFQGTGVGLAICNRIVERHGGRLWAQARPGKGATLFFTLGESQS